MALTKRASIMLANLARRGDMYARQALNMSSAQNDIVQRNLARRGDVLAQRNIQGATNSSPRVKAMIARLARSGDTIVQGLKALATDKIAQTITGFSPSANKTFGNAPFSLSATMSANGLPVQFRVKSGPATVSGATLTLTGAGTVVVTAYQDGDANHSAATPVDATITVAKSAQTITFTPPASADHLTDSPMTLSATASSSLAVVFTVQSGPATVSGNQLTLTGSGTVVVNANQAGNANYNAATQVQRSITVS